MVASHAHDDHGAADTIPGDPLVFVHPVAETVGSLRITGVEVAHDEAGGAKRGKNTIMVLDDGDIRLVHLGDLGHALDAATVEAIGRVDVLLVPVGGFFTIDHEEAAAVVEALDPRIVIPMHYKTDKIDFPIAAVDPFLATQKAVERKDDSTLEVTGTTLPAERVTVVLRHVALEGAAPCRRRRPHSVLRSFGLAGSGPRDRPAVWRRLFGTASTSAWKDVATFAFANRGVFLTLDDSPVLEGLTRLAERGCPVYVCGTCMDYYGVRERLAVGEPGSIPLLQQLMCAATKVVTF